jgi:ribonucleoside-diphosphate reductase alpha chain
MVDFQFRNEIARSVYYNKYALSQSETWPERCRAIAEDVVGTMSGRRRRLISKGDQDAIWLMMVQMKFIPGGRYIYYAGRRAHFFNNCLTGATEIMTPHGPKRLDSLQGKTVSVLSPADGLWHESKVHYHGEQECFHIEFSNIKGNQQVIRRVSATADHRWLLADGSIRKGLRIGDVVPATIPQYASSDEGFLHGFVFGDGNVHILKDSFAHQLRLCGSKKNHLERLAPFASTITYPPSANGEPVLYIKSQRNLKELPLVTGDPSYIRGFIEGWVAADGHAGSTCILHTVSREAIDFFLQHSSYAGLVVTGEVRSVTKPSNFGTRRELYSVTFQGAETFAGFKVVNIGPMGLMPVFCPEEPETTLFTLAGGMATGNCFLLRAEYDTREEWASLAQRATNCLMTGGGIGVDYSVLREKGRSISRTGGVASGPLGLAEMINNIGRNVMQGGSRRSAIYGSLLWTHPDARDWLTAKDWDAKKIGSMSYGDLKRMDYNFSAPLDMSNISLNYDDEFLHYVSRGTLPDIFIENMRYACMNGEPGFSFNFGAKSNETLRNACTEVTSEDDSDVCNLGSINMANIETIEEFRDVVHLAAKFLVCGTLRADLPYAKVYEVRERNRRLGLGLMGIHEWLLKRGYRYGMNDELRAWLQVYKEESERAANEHCDRLYLNRPAGYRAIAPTGSIAMLAGTTSGIEPLYSVAYKRRYLVGGDKWKYEYVVDSTAKMLIEEGGYDADSIESAVDLAREPERRIAFQADVQDYVDHAISSTINLPQWGSEGNNEDTVPMMANILARYAHRLRGFTCYPDGARGGQPIQSVPYTEAIGNEGNVYSESHDLCEITGKGGTCGS